ncbi:hypothetical protein Tco_0487360 [Tanacetum coccineum]
MDLSAISITILIGLGFPSLSRQNKEKGIILMLAPKSANALLTVVVSIVQGRMKLPGSFSLGDVLLNHLLAIPTRVRGNTRERAESFVLNKLAILSTFPTCSIAFSVELHEKVVLRKSLAFQEEALFDLSTYRVKIMIPPSLMLKQFRIITILIVKII